MGEKCWEVLLSGVSGWVFVLLPLLLGGGYAVHTTRRKRKVNQSRARAGGSIAGGDIIRGEDVRRNAPKDADQEDLAVDQSGVDAEGDIAGGDIVSRDNSG